MGNVAPATFDELVRLLMTWPVLAVLSMSRNTTQRADTQFLQVARQEYRVDRRRLHHFEWFAKGPALDLRLSDCRGHVSLIALDSHRTVGQGKRIFISSLPLTRRMKYTPSSSEGLAYVVRRRACPSSYEVLTGSVRRKGEVPILPPPKSSGTR